MTLDVRINGQSLAEILTTPPRINDQLSAACRTLEVQVVAADGLNNRVGNVIELWYAGKRWFYGVVFRRKFDANKNVTYVAYDPLYYLKRHMGDFYFKKQTATQIFQHLCGRVGIKAAKIANTGAVFPYLHYPKQEAEKVAVDSLARTALANGKKFWYRFDPDVSNFGLTVFERVVPKKVWAFQQGINLTAATYEESAEESYNVIRLVNRETGKVVQKVDQTAAKNYGQMVYMEEVDKDQVKQMDSQASKLLKEKAQLKQTMSIEGINPDATMPQFFSGDVIYVEEDYTQIIGAYHIVNITQTFVSDRLVLISADVQAAPDIPPVQVNEADKRPEKKK